MVEQIIAVEIFAIMFAIIISEKIERHWVSTVCGALMLITVFGICRRDPAAIWDTLNLKAFVTPGFWYSGGKESLSSGVNWSTISFLFGMMVMVEGMGKAGFFRWLCLRIAGLVKYRALPIFISFMIMSFVLAMFIDSITVILFLAAVTIELGSLLKFPPTKLILAEIFCANLGGSATMCGDPPNIIIGTSLGYSFMDFVLNTGFIALICLIFTVLYFYICCHGDFAASGEVTEYPDPKAAIVSQKGFIASSCIFACAVILLVTHAVTGLTVSAIGIFIAFVTLIASGREALSLLKKIDYKTLVFFIGLFVVVGGLEATGILAVIAGLIERICKGNAYLMIAVILWISAISSAFIDNIPFAATMVPVIQSLAATSGVDLPVLAWTLAVSTDIGGSATPIGASANVVGVSIAARNGQIISWGKYLKTMVPITVIVMIICMICIYIRYL